jgi:hypothetical protein
MMIDMPTRTHIHAYPDAQVAYSAEDHGRRSEQHHNLHGACWQLHTKPTVLATCMVVLHTGVSSTQKVLNLQSASPFLLYHEMCESNADQAFAK